MEQRRKDRGGRVGVNVEAEDLERKSWSGRVEVEELRI
jgi:hypothetical protein